MWDRIQSIKRLQDRKLRGAAQETFWQEYMDQNSYPLVVIQSGNTSQMLFVCKLDVLGSFIELHSDLVRYGEHSGDFVLLENIEHTNIYYALCELPTSAQGSYYFKVSRPNDKPFYQHDEFNPHFENYFGLKKSLLRGTSFPFRMNGITDLSLVDGHANVRNLREYLVYPDGTFRNVEISTYERTSNANLRWLTGQMRPITDGARRAWIYETTPDTQNFTSTSLTIALDGYDIVSQIGLPQAMEAFSDNIEEHQVVVMIDAGRHRFNEYKPMGCHSNESRNVENLMAFICNALIPSLENEFNQGEAFREINLFGFCLGGFAASYIFFRNLTLFSGLACLSGEFLLDDGSLCDMLERLNIHRDELKEKRLFLAWGQYEPTIITKGNEELTTFLEYFDSSLQSIIYPGGHDFTCWRDLTRFAVSRLNNFKVQDEMQQLYIPQFAHQRSQSEPNQSSYYSYESEQGLHDRLVKEPQALELGPF